MSLRMPALVFALIVYGLAVFFTARAALSQQATRSTVLCMPVEVLYRTTKARGEEYFAAGDVLKNPEASQYKIVLFFSKKDKQFTIAALNKARRSACVLAAGYKWEELEKPPLPSKKP